MSIRTLIIGLGQIGMGYDIFLDPTKFVFTHARAASLHEQFEIIAGIDPDKGRCDLFELHYKVPAYGNISCIKDLALIDMVVIASPSLLHMQTFDEVIKRLKPKIILCEKPLSFDIDESRFMVETCKNLDIKLFVNYMRRSDPGAIKIKEMISNGIIKQPFKGVAWYSKGFFNNASHLFNLLEDWFGNFQDFTLINEGRFWDNTDPEPDVIVKFQNAEVTFLSAWEEYFSHYTIELLSSSGRLRYEQGGEIINFESIYADPNIAGYKILNPKAILINNNFSHYQTNVYNQIANAFNNKNYHLCNGDQALRTLEFMHKITNLRKL